MHIFIYNTQSGGVDIRWKKVPLKAKRKHEKAHRRIQKATADCKQLLFLYVHQIEFRILTDLLIN